MYLVLYHVLLYNWRHFFKSSAVRTLMAGGDSSNNQSPGEGGNGIHDQAHFSNILQAFGQSFLLPDISVFKQNLAALEDINAKWKLYHKVRYMVYILTCKDYLQFLTMTKIYYLLNVCAFSLQPIFTQEFIVQFLMVLIQALVNNSHNLLKEEITLAVYNMASVDFIAFFNQFLLQFLESQELDSNQKNILKTSFKTDTVSSIIF